MYRRSAVWYSSEYLRPIGNGSMSEVEARAIAERELQRLDTNEWLMMGYPEDAKETATFTLGHGRLYDPARRPRLRRSDRDTSTLAWRFSVETKYQGPDQQGKMLEWTRREWLTAIRNVSMSEAEAHEIAERQLQDPDTCAALLMGYPEEAVETATFTIIWSRLYYEKPLGDLDD